MRTLNLFRLSRWDGGDRTVPTPYHFTTRASGEVQAGPHDSLSEVQIVILEDGDDLKDAERSVTAARAASKLSANEREAIGLPRDLTEAINKVTGGGTHTRKG